MPFILGTTTVHAAIFVVRGYNLTTRHNDLLDHALRHHDAIVSYPNWACTFLGFHSFGLYIHNDNLSALGHPKDISSGWQGGFVTYSVTNRGFLVHHIYAYTIHVMVSILLKGVLFACSSSLILDKVNLGFHFPCDGPGRGSDVWDNMSDQGIVTHITGGNFMQNSVTINGWLPHFLWFFIIYIWPFSQELIKSIVWARNKLQVSPATQSKVLSIVQGHAVGVTYYLLGGIFTTWAFF
ncbi:Photosystem I [Handroanthus impetiginosus]|uniref:Photosystem I n=1 Tax=Handroanthus impetiginosus TaxID=429701 RepID=A0A2G9GTE7_9LAMI|nr:Photosystem I [Handroanthus impetiginosus]